jgi:hypothetical protein
MLEETYKRKTVKSTGNCSTLAKVLDEREYEGRNVNNAPVTEIIGISMEHATGKRCL